MGNSSRKSDCQIKIAEITPQSLMNSQLEAEQELSLIEQMKDRRRTELILLEQQRAQQLQEEVELNNSSRAHKNEIIHEVSESQKQLENKIFHVHQEQEEAKAKFAQQLTKSEAEIQKSINNVLKETSMFRDQVHLREVIEAEELQAQSLMALKLEEYQTLRKAEILSSMQQQLELNIRIPECSSSMWKTQILDEEERNRSQIEGFLRDRQKDRSQLVSTLLKEETWQYHAFRSLLSSRDRRTAQINKDIRAVVDHLNQLTELEKRRKTMQQDLTTNSLAENRIELAELLVQLIRQQEERRLDMKNLLSQMEAQREEQAEDYWLMQYQRLMENMPESTNQLDKFSRYSSTPTAPRLSSSDFSGLSSLAPIDGKMLSTASAPTANEVFTESSCVICLDDLCHVIFLPCGHMCCCVACGDPITLCPLCRADVAQKLVVRL